MHLKNAPLVHVLAQVVFSPVPHMERCVPGIHAKLQSIGFPWLNEGVTHHVTLTDGATPTVTLRKRWDFLDRDRRTGVALSDSWVVLQTTDYVTAEPFLAQLRRAAEILKAEAGIELVQRLGLRYIDLVRLEAGEQFEDYVQPGLLGFPFGRAPGLEATVLSLRTEALASTPNGVLAVRCTLLPPGQFLPPDLTPSPIAHPASLAVGGPGLALDFDHFLERTFDFDPAVILEQMDLLRSALHEAFLAAGTDHAFARWGPWEEVPV